MKNSFWINNRRLKLLAADVLTVRERAFLGLAVVLLLMLAWSGFTAFMHRPFSFLNILFIHHYFPVWIVDFFILAFPVIIVILKNFLRNYIAGVKKSLNENIERYERNIHLAKALKENNLGTIEPNGDVLSETLLDLGKSIRISKKREEEHNWITRGKDQISDILRNAHNMDDLAFNTLKSIIDYMGGVQGALYILNDNVLKRAAMYAYGRRRFEYHEIAIGKGLIGAAAYEKAMIYRTEIPDDYYIITSGLLGEQKPKSIVILPLLQEENLQGVMEIAFLTPSVSALKLHFASEVSSIIGQTIYNLRITTRTQHLLKESQEMTAALRENEEKLRENAQEMIAAQEELEKSNKLLETQVQEVANARKRLEALLTNASEFISIYNEKQELVFESPSVKRILGYNDDDKISGIDPEILTPRGLRTINNLFQFLLDTPGGEQTAQYTYLRKNGEKLYLETKGKNLLHDPAIRGIIFNTQDITERRRAEKEERMKSRMQSLSENSPDMIMRVNLSGKLAYVNPAVANFMGVSAADLLKKRIQELSVDQRLIDFMQKTITQIRDNHQQSISEVAIGSDSGERVMEIKSIPELSEDGSLDTILFVAHDMTEIKKIEAEIKEKNKKISDSINYAQRIQTAILPDTRLIQEYFPRSFIFYRPKDVVSGDFPWFFQKNDISYVAAVDCTGHGVPGALISFIGYFLLNNIVNAQSDNTAAQILDELHQSVRSTLKQDKEGAMGRDGMDLALCIIDQKNKVLQFAGAHRPLYLLRNGELIEYSGTRKGIGGIPLAKKVEKDFENHIINYHDGDQIFFFSDGLPDQIGGDKRKKYQPRRIRENLTSNPDASMASFSRLFSRDFYDWMGDEKQVDDVLLIGIEL
ncbi:PAS domain S-box protein [Geofilum sp. OHC36d9]|uniref:PAS domain S-box protein n=1 Tax=Geofilum sp. OHC36d9 TaxID=3458413 RepID=UPI004034400F